MVVRYQLIVQDGEMEAHPQGDWVEYDEYVNLEQKYQELCEKVREAWMEIP